MMAANESAITRICTMSLPLHSDTYGNSWRQSSTISEVNVQTCKNGNESETVVFMHGRKCWKKWTGLGADGVSFPPAMMFQMFYSFWGLWCPLVESYSNMRGTSPSMGTIRFMMQPVVSADAWLKSEYISSLTGKIWQFDFSTKVCVKTESPTNVPRAEIVGCRSWKNLKTPSCQNRVPFLKPCFQQEGQVPDVNVSSSTTKRQ